jgi:solute carrier family 39 (zinc transporter), member 9
VSKSGKETIVNLAEHSDHAEGVDVHSLIGVALVLGFVFMLLVDQISAKRGI